MLTNTNGEMTVLNVKQYRNPILLEDEGVTKSSELEIIRAVAK